MSRSRTLWTIIVVTGTFLFLGLTGVLIYLQYNPPVSKAMDEAAEIRFQKAMDSIRKVLDDSAGKAESVSVSKKALAESDSMADPFKRWRIVYIGDNDRWAICVGQSKSIRTKNGEYTEPRTLYAGKEKKPGVLYDDWIKYDTTVTFYGGTGIREALTFEDSIEAVKWLTRFKIRFRHN
jgi:hypothetical protein